MFAAIRRGTRNYFFFINDYDVSLAEVGVATFEVKHSYFKVRTFVASFINMD